MGEHVCFGCFSYFSLEDEEERKCPECNDDNVMKTYNASDGVTIADRNLY